MVWRYQDSIGCKLFDGLWMVSEIIVYNTNNVTESYIRAIKCEDTIQTKYGEINRLAVLHKLVTIYEHQIISKGSAVIA